MTLPEQPLGAGRCSDGEADAEDGCQATRLLASKRAMSQEEFAQVLQRHPGRDVNELFAFRKPRHGLAKARKNASTVLALTPAQHAVMYALAGCIDVNNVMSRVQHPVRNAIENHYGIDRQAFYLWFKNRAPQARRTKPTRPPPSPRGASGGSGRSSPTSSSPPQTAPNPASECEAGLFELSDGAEACFSSGSLSAASMAQLMQAGQLGRPGQLQLQGLLQAGPDPATVLLPQTSSSRLDSAQVQQLLLSDLAMADGPQATHMTPEPSLQLSQLPPLHTLSGLQMPVVLGVASMPAGMASQAGIGQGGLMCSAGLNGIGALGAGAAVGLGAQQTLAQPVMQLEQQQGPNNSVRLVLVQAPNRHMQQQQQQQQQLQQLQQQQQQQLRQLQQLQQQRLGMLSAPNTTGLAAAIQQYHELSCRSAMGPGVGGMNLVLATAPGSGGGYKQLGQPMHMLLSQQGLGQAASVQLGQVGLQGLQGYQQAAAPAGRHVSCDLPNLPAVPGLELRLAPRQPADLSAVTVRSSDALKLQALDQAAAAKVAKALAPEPQVGQSTPTLDNLHMLATAHKASEPQGGQSAPTLDNLLDALRRTGYAPWTLDSRSPCQSTSTAGSLPATISM